jgi:tetratricopeptide (TPR) repeat protein
MIKPLCFVLMPFGKKPDAAGTTIDFDRVYSEIIQPAVVEAGLEPLRADEEMNGGIIHKPMYERLILCEYAVADLTTANANVFYELGLRHAVRRWSTVMIFANGERLPFDVALLRALPYRLNAMGTPEAADKDREALSKRLKAARQAAIDDPKGDIDSPLFQLVENFPDVDHTKTDVFRERVHISNEIKTRLAKARKQGLDAVKQVETEMGDLSAIESAAVIDLYLSYRAVEGWQEMIELAKNMPKPLSATVMVQEQLGLALNRAGRRDDAEKVLLDLIERRGRSSETMGILGRVYKDRWKLADKGGNKLLADGLLDKAIEAYLSGFQADWRDSYPGVNAVTLMEVTDPVDPRQEKLLPVVRYAVEQRLTKGQPDYWDYATLMELAILRKSEQKARDFAGKALAVIREDWERKTTLSTLQMILKARSRRGEEVGWLAEIEQAFSNWAPS